MKLFLLVTVVSLLVLSLFSSTAVLAEESSVQVEAAAAAEQGSAATSESTAAAPEVKEEEAGKAVDENLQELVTASVDFPKERRLIYGKSIDYVVKVKNDATQNIFVTGIVPSYPGRDKITLPSMRNVQLVASGKSEDIKASFVCELDVKKVNFMVQVLVFNPKDHSNPIKIDAYSGSLPVHRPGNDWFDTQSLGIYAMLIVLGYFSYVWVCSRYQIGSAGSHGKTVRDKKKKTEKDTGSKASLTADTEWIPKHNLQLSSNRLRMQSSVSSEIQSTTSFSEPSSDEEQVVRKQK